MRALHRYRSLDAWRGLLCLRVVTYHATAALEAPPVSTGTWIGSIGVPLFFVISGFCIASACQKMPGGLAFFVKRFRRIYPPYWAALAILLIASLWWPDLFDMPRPDQMTLSGWIGNLTLTETWRPHVGGSAARLIAVQAWTLCYEEQFYIVSGVALLLLGGHRFLFSMFAVTVAVLIIMSVRPGAAVTGYFFDGTWLLFAEGVALSWLVRQSPRIQWLGGLGLGSLGMSTVMMRSPAWWHFDAFAIGPLFTVLLLVLYRWDGPIMQWRWVRPLTVCGTMAYSIFLIHPVVTVPVVRILVAAGWRDWTSTLLVAIPLSVVGSVAAGWTFHSIIERRFMIPPVVGRTTTDARLAQLWFGASGFNRA